jgi:hypothetical protein
MARIDDGLVTYIDTSDHLISADVELLPARSLRDATIRNCPMASTAPAGGAVVPIRPATAKCDLGHDPVVADSTGLVVEQVRLVVGGHRRVDDVTFTARPGTLTTNIGPSGTGKSTLIKVLAWRNGAQRRPRSFRWPTRTCRKRLSAEADRCGPARRCGASSTYRRAGAAVRRRVTTTRRISGRPRKPGYPGAG